MGTAWKRLFAVPALALSIGLCAQAARTAAKPAKAPAAKATPAAATSAALPSAAAIWKDTRAKWDSTKSYSTDLFAWNYRTQWFIDHFPEARNISDVKENKKPSPDWSYRVYKLRFKKPTKAIVLYAMSTNEKTEQGGLIDRAVAYVLTYVSNTALIYGVKDPQLLYIVFPYISPKQFDAMPIGLQWKAAMKLLMYASRSEVYWKYIDDMKDARGNIMARYDHYFKDGKVTASMSPQYVREDFVNTKEGWLSMKPGIKKPATMYKLTMVPNDVKKNRGMSKVELFIDPTTKMFSGMIEYESGKMVQVMLFDNLKLDVDLPDKLWDDYFKGRTLSDKK
jgi:hypothetical protein